MLPILRIYTADLSRIARNWAAAVIVLGLVCLPSLYAWFNIEASWDPYGQTGGLVVAVTNLDQGAAISGKPVRIGDEIVESLKNNPAIGWVFVNEGKAMRGVQHGDYYASIVIPDDFSAKIGTIVTDNPQKAELVYTVNEKVNAVSPKITGKGASGIIQQVNHQFIKTANGTIFRIMNEIGIELESSRPTIETVRDTLFKLEAMIPENEKAAAAMTRDVRKAEEIAAGVQSRLPVIAQLAQDGALLADRLSAVLERGSEAIQAAGPDVGNDLQLLKTTADSAKLLVQSFRDGTASAALPELGLERLSRRLSAAADTTEVLLSLFNRLNGFLAGNPLSGAADKLGQAQEAFRRMQRTTDSLRDAIASGTKSYDALLSELEQGAGQASEALDSLLGRYETELIPQIVQGLTRTRESAQTALDVLKQANAALPEVSRLVSDAASVLAASGNALQTVSDSLPAAAAKIHGLADRIRALEREGNLNDLIGLLRKDADKTSEFFAEPAVLHENRLFPIPNYGSAMSPFFTTLSLWVGALLLVSLLSVDAGSESGVPQEGYVVYFGRFLTFWTLAVLQSLLVTIGDLVFLGTYAANPVWFVLFGAVTSSVFMLIVYTLVSVFGNVGKAMAIVLLVLQLAGSGGTFPVQVTPAFFQAIHPFLPFTYAISLMREAVGGLLWDIAIRDLCLLGVYAALFLIIGITLKDWINRVSAGVVRKAKESRLIH
ncbi:YhgE/Pip domain-containing protein [Paenibacillus oceani]|uniref:YhgE/Pip domain-containing protein n=1 Tax=Paenibacillus oceani TaxID=2772510 RepID=A0A927H4U0_9BACL|nr:YhgE/Pip domain-containing protein [Paenibacillus oceani]MBD2866854.1 YhgE/Pip domain-containing protein [Paenibacillus oceani]